MQRFSCNLILLTTRFINFFKLFFRVVIHNDVELPGPTGLGEEESPEPGALLLQDHWDPVFYRNVWMAPRGRE